MSREARCERVRRIFGAHAADLRAQLLRCSLTQLSNALAPLLVASPASQPPGSLNLSPNPSATPLAVLALALLVAFGLFGRQAWRLYRIVREGKPTSRFDELPSRVRAEAVVVVGQSKLLQRLGPGLMHAVIFWGFIVLFPTIVIAMIGAADPHATLPWLGAQGWYALLVDVFAVGVLAGVIAASAIRLVQRPKRFAGSHLGEANLILAWIGGIVISLLLWHSSQIVLGLNDYPREWAPVSNLISGALQGDWVAVLERVAVWTHVLLILGFLVYLPYSKHLHILVAAINVFFTRLVPNAVTDNVVWDCVTCGACVQECPVGIEHIDHIVDLRRNLVMVESRFPEEAGAMLRDVDRASNPWGKPQADRAAWADGLDVRVLQPGEAPPDVLFWVGCAPAFDERAKQGARSTAKLLKQAGVDFAILGPREACTGDPARRMGDEYTYQRLARQKSWCAMASCSPRRAAGRSRITTRATSRATTTCCRRRASWRRPQAKRSRCRVTGAARSAAAREARACGWRSAAAGPSTRSACAKRPRPAPTRWPSRARSAPSCSTTACATPARRCR